ncbi:MAG TPA: hypothetical protein VFI03_07140 [Solirubrobacterales bacterium]|nr:hypothetical protein [Solirubrobacterales bacterium]
MSSATPRTSLAAVATTATLILSLALAGTASAATPVTKDGTIHACYRVKGKPKGAMRVVKSGKARCQRGERKLAWVATGAVGAAGAAGSAGAAGTDGVNGAAGQAGAKSVLSTSQLEETVDLLTARVVSLEGVLNGIGNDDLLGVLDKLDGVTKAQLLEAVAAVPVLKSVCGRVSTLITQTNLLGSGVDGLVSTLTGSLLGSIFGSVDLPEALDPFACTGI